MTSRRAPASNGAGQRTVGALLCLAVAAIHVADQGGIPGSKEPFYVGVGYHALEIAAVVAALLLLTRAASLGWLLAVGVSLGPIVGYVLSRGPGLPHYRDDVGNWSEPLGVASLVVEAALLGLALAALSAAIGPLRGARSEAGGREHRRRAKT